MIIMVKDIININMMVKDIIRIIMFMFRDIVSVRPPHQEPGQSKTGKKRNRWNIVIVIIIIAIVIVIIIIIVIVIKVITIINIILEFHIV